MGKLSRLLLASALMVPILGTGCASQPAYGPAETPHYLQWEHETHRDHVDWEKRNDTDHRAYWEWRKNHRN
jgi:hypothetical protein